MSVYGELRRQENDADGSFLTACSRKQIRIYIWIVTSWTVLPKERCLCGYCSSVQFLTLLLGKDGFCLSFVTPSPLSLTWTRWGSSQLGLEMQCLHILIFRAAKTLQGVSCPLSSADRDIYCKTIMTPTPLSQSCCWSLLLSSEPSECWFLPSREFLTHHCMTIPAWDLSGSQEHPGDNGTAQLDEKNLKILQSSLQAPKRTRTSWLTYSKRWVCRAGCR